MNNTNMKRRINVREFADRLGCHPATVKRRIKKPPVNFPIPTLIWGKWTWAEDEADGYVEYLIEQSRNCQNAWFRSRSRDLDEAPALQTTIQQSRDTINCAYVTTKPLQSRVTYGTRMYRANKQTTSTKAGRSELGYQASSCLHSGQQPETG